MKQSLSEEEEVSTRRSRRARKRVQDSNFVFIWFWIPDLQIYLLARHVQRTFDEDKHENQMFSLSLVYCFFPTTATPLGPCYIDTSVLLDNIPPLNSWKLHPGPQWCIFHYLTCEFYRWRNFSNFPLLFYLCLFVYIIKRTLHGGLKIWILFSSGKNNILLTRCARS